MNCSNCGNLLESSNLSFVVCPICHWVNNPVSTSQSQSRQPTKVQNSSSNNKPIYFRPLKTLFLTRRNVLFAVLAVMVLLVIGSGCIGAYQINRNDSLLASARTKISQEQYSDADQLLKQTTHYFALPSTRKQIRILQSKNNEWMSDEQYMQEADALSQKNMFTEALDILKKISGDFPGYKKVIALSASIEARQKAGVAVEVAKTETGTKAPAQSSPSPKPVDNSSPKKSSKRFTSTAAITSLANAKNISEAQQALQTFGSQYGLMIQITNVTKSSYAGVTFGVLSESDLASLKSYGSLFIDEWAKYPTDWVTNSKLKSIALVKNFAFSGTIRAAGPDPINKTMYYSVYYSGDYAREVIHHEYNHLLTYSYSGSYSPSDPKWTSLNPPGFKYGNGGASCYVPSNSCLTGAHPISGFVSGYAASAIEEDKAELYGYLMDSAYYQQVKNWIVSDQYLANKVNNYKQFIASHSSQMSGSYFDDINL